MPDQTDNGVAPPVMFVPEGEFAVQAQQNAIDRLRREKIVLEDRNVYLEATLLQFQREAQIERARLLGEISLLKGEHESAEQD